MQTPRRIAIDNGYWHYGLEKALRRMLQVAENIPEKVSLNFNIDGIPISKSSSIQFWPILFDVDELPYIPPGAIGIYCGTGIIKKTLRSTYTSI